MLLNFPNMPTSKAEFFASVPQFQLDALAMATNESYSSQQQSNPCGTLTTQSMT